MNAYIKGISYYLPYKVLTNEDLTEKFPEWTVEKVSSKVGINQRHLAAFDETAGDMAFQAAVKLFDEYDIKREQIDFILLCTQSPDYFLPTTACILQDRLGLPTTVGAVDINLGCSGYVYGLSIAKGLILGGIAKNVLLLTGETYSKYIHPTDKGNLTIFGDGASATLVSCEKGMAEIGNFSLGTDGRGAENLMVRSGAARHKETVGDYDRDDGGYVKSSDYLYMNGSEIFNFTLVTIPPLLKNVLSKNDFALENIDLHIFHQANKFILSTIRKICGIPKEKFYINLENTGNTVSSTLPIAIKNVMNEGKLEKGMNVVLAGFGVGYSWGATILKF